MAETWTVQSTLGWTTEYFKSKQIESARTDAEILLARVLKIRRLDLYLRFEQILGEAELGQFREAVKRRARNEPVAYIIGEREFYGRVFKVGPGVLIPRPETELLVDEALGFLTADIEFKVTPLGEQISAVQTPVSQTDVASPVEVAETPSNMVWAKLGPKQTKERKWRYTQPLILDVGAGSGCLGVTLALEIPTAKVTAIEKNSAAAALCRTNIKLLNVEDRLTFIENDFDLSENFLSPDFFDIIVTNPPYIGTSESVSLPNDVKDFEPHEALFGGARGEELICRWLPLYAKTLKSGGLLVVEIGEKQGGLLAQIARQTELFHQVSIMNDYSGKPRILKAIKK